MRCGLPYKVWPNILDPWFPAVRPSIDPHDSKRRIHLYGALGWKLPKGDPRTPNNQVSNSDIRRNTPFSTFRPTTEAITWVPARKPYPALMSQSFLRNSSFCRSWNSEELNHSIKLLLGQYDLPEVPAPALTFINVSPKAAKHIVSIEWINSCNTGVGGQITVCSWPFTIPLSKHMLIVTVMIARVKCFFLWHRHCPNKGKDFSSWWCKKKKISVWLFCMLLINEDEVRLGRYGLGLARQCVMTVLWDV